MLLPIGEFYLKMTMTIVDCGFKSKQSLFAFMRGFTVFRPLWCLLLTFKLTVVSHFIFNITSLDEKINLKHCVSLRRMATQNVWNLDILVNQLQPQFYQYFFVLLFPQLGILPRHEWSKTKLQNTMREVAFRGWLNSRRSEHKVISTGIFTSVNSFFRYRIVNELLPTPPLPTTHRRNMIPGSY